MILSFLILSKKSIVNNFQGEKILNQTAITFVALGGAVLLWSLGTGLTSYIAEGPAREYNSKAHSEHATKNPEKAQGDFRSEEDVDKFVQEELKKLAAELDNSIKENNTALSEEIRVKTANFLFESGIRFSKSEYLKNAVGGFNEILQINPNQKDALLGLGTLSLHVGAGDKAVEYYEKYLIIEPNDLSIKSNLALAKARFGKTDDAIKLIDSVIKSDPKLVIALVTKGIILRDLGKKDQALALFNQAEKLETNPALITRIKELKEDRKDQGKENVHAESIIEYFRNHEIIGKKLKDLKVDKDQLQVFLEDFPVDKMPEFAKAKLEGNIKLELKNSKYVKVSLFDAGTKKILLEIAK